MKMFLKFVCVFFALIVANDSINAAAAEPPISTSQEIHITDIEIPDEIRLLNNQFVFSLIKKVYEIENSKLLFIYKLEAPNPIFRNKDDCIYMSQKLSFGKKGSLDFTWAAHVLYYSAEGWCYTYIKIPNSMSIGDAKKNSAINFMGSFLAILIHIFNFGKHCEICNESFGGPTSITFLECMHCFHRYCIEASFEDEDQSCPICGQHFTAAISSCNYANNPASWLEMNREVPKPKNLVN